MLRNGILACFVWSLFCHKACYFELVLIVGFTGVNAQYVLLIIAKLSFRKEKILVKEHVRYLAFFLSGMNVSLYCFFALNPMFMGVAVLLVL
jgi:hypothetical protein